MQRGLRQRFVEAHPGFEPYIEEILPKKAQLDSVKLYVFPLSASKPNQTNPIQTKPSPNSKDC